MIRINFVYYEGLKKTELKPSPGMQKDRKAQALKNQGTVPTLALTYTFLAPPQH